MLRALGKASSEKQVPQVVGKLESGAKSREVLETVELRVKRFLHSGEILTGVVRAGGTAPLLPGRQKRTYITCPPETLKTSAKFVHVLYKRAEIPANSTLRAIAVSVTYGKQENAANTGSILVGQPWS